MRLVDIDTGLCLVTFRAKINSVRDFGLKKSHLSDQVPLASLGKDKRIDIHRAENSFCQNEVK